MKRVFLDANVFFAGFASPEGASALILKGAVRGKFLLLANRIVLREADRNLRLKTDPKTIKAFHRFLGQTKIQVCPRLPEAVLARYESLIHPKDVPVLASALEAKADFLVTLDRRHFLIPAVLTHRGKTKILTPGDFLREWI